MPNWPTIATRVALSGGAATLTSTAALALLARAEGHAPLQPVNATSHWLNGPGAARQRTRTARHTGVGFATHAAATLFWAALFEAWIARRPSPTRPAAATLLRDATILSAVAALVDYTITPKRFTPGWEFVLSKRAMAAAYAAMAAGLAVGRAAAE